MASHRLHHILYFALLVHGVQGLQVLHSSETELPVDDDFGLWDGADSDDLADLHLSARNDSDPIYYILLAPMDSGSNLLARLIEANWPRRKDSYDFIWKHSLGSAEEIYNYLRTKPPLLPLQNVHFIAAVRSPISQVVSWMNAPYDLTPCVWRKQKELTEPCSAALHYRYHEEGLPMLNFSSVMDIYNKYLSLYQQVLADGKFKSAQIITYEDMVLSPEGVLRQISDTFGEKLPSSPRTIEKAAKPAQKKMVRGPNGREAALQKLARRSYLKYLHRETISALCSQLNKSLVADIVESKHVKARKPYTLDCDSL